MMSHCCGRWCKRYGVIKGGGERMGLGTILILVGTILEEVEDLKDT